MAYKRPFGDEEDCRVVVSKHPRHSDDCNQLASCMEVSPCVDSTLNSQTSDDVSFNKRHVSDINLDLRDCGHTEFEIAASGSLSSSWLSDRSETTAQMDDACLPHLAYGPRKLVSIGPNYQADIPQYSSSASTVNENIEKFVGYCVIPMPTEDARTSDSTSVEYGKDDCRCPDQGSVRCARKHIMESRDRLRVTLGCETFAKLGFYEMGEVVARKWIEQEERDFHEVVFTNSASSGKSFWDRLSAVFPSRTKKELVSYYFNVFMLRQRAEQNRLDSLDIDSDNDEWGGSDEDEDEIRTTEENEDSAVESPQEDPILYENNEVDDNDDEDTGDDESIADEDYCSFGPGFHTSSKMLQNSEDIDAQDDSCLSFECQASKEEGFCRQTDTSRRQNQVENNHGEDYLHCTFDERLNNVSLEHGYVFGSYDSKVWDVGYLDSFKEGVDFLSTFNMIEEVFGNEALNNKKGNSDGKSVS
ncbi:hypothetical protein MKW94_017883 [Papaver nudicaule]|uniref:AT-rich interactive domain-containing protein 2 n=1 Tax=Papaver nudicaule TaxID=74823 RepID=A0AA42B0Z6_PAPNU|nr:hypothetical protein [Papaver nudicaule]